MKSKQILYLGLSFALIGIAGAALEIASNDFSMTPYTIILCSLGIVIMGIAIYRIRFDN